MRGRRALVVLAFSMVLRLAGPAVAASAPDAGNIAAHTAGMRRMDGLFPLSWDAKAGRLFLTIPSARFDQDFLLVDSLPYGLGSNDLGLDRGKLGTRQVVHFSRFGAKVLLIAPNLQYRSSSPHAEERMAVKESFAESVMAGFKVEAETDGAVLVDATDFFMGDAFGVAEQLELAKQGAYRIDKERSAITLENTKNFPLNTEVESLLTFSTEHLPEDSLVATVSPDAHFVTLREHYSLIQLPGPGFEPRAFDPRAGYFDQSYRDYSAALGLPLDQHFILRHRLEKKDPGAAVSEPVKPIVYYVDRGAPEPIRSALVEGANWWSEAFEAAGFKNAFRVEVLPEGADPMDIRYNMIQWVHRSTRGWSYGDAIADPRTGEIIKGQVTLGSLRARQDFMIAEALLSPYEKGKPVSPEMQAMVLARIRQLAAHEVGHTLGLAHNFAASSIGAAMPTGTSVMDYPHPWVTLDADGRPDLSHAYPAGIGAWDKISIAYGYSQFAAGADERAGLNGILEKAQSDGLYFITDEDARPPGSAHPHAHLWDNGGDPAVELERILAVRSAAMKRFGENAIPVGTPLAELEDTLVPLYLLHRYQTEAAAKEIGGLDYRYALRGDGQMVSSIVSGIEQKRALDAVLKTLDPVALTLPEPVLRILPPRPPGYPRTRESFPGHTGLAFDAEGAAESAAGMTVGLLFNPERASRLVEYHARDRSTPGLADVLDAVLGATWKAPRVEGLAGVTQGVTDRVVLEGLLGLAASKIASPVAAGIARGEAVTLRKWLLRPGAAGSAEQAMLWAAAVARIESFEREPDKFTPVAAVAAPPGQPIGDDE